MELKKELLDEYKNNVHKQIVSANEIIQQGKGALQVIEALLARLEKQEKSEVSNESGT